MSYEPIASAALYWSLQRTGVCNGQGMTGYDQQRGGVTAASAQSSQLKIRIFGGLIALER